METHKLTIREQSSLIFYWRCKKFSSCIKYVRAKFARAFSLKSLHKHKGKTKRIGGRLLPYQDYYKFSAWSRFRIWFKNRTLKGTEPSWDLFEIDEGVKIQRVKFAHVLSANGSLYLIPSELLVTKSFISFIEAMTEKKVISAEGKHVDFEINGHKRSRTLRKIYFENDPNPWYFHNRTCKLSKRKHLGNIISEYEGTRMITTSEGVVNISITAERISYIVKRKITL